MSLSFALYALFLNAYYDLEINILDVVTQEPLPKSYLIINSQKKTYSDSEGKIYLNVSEGDTVEIYHQSYYPQYLIFGKIGQFDSFNYKQLNIYLTFSKQKISEKTMKNNFRKKKLKLYDYEQLRGIETKLGLEKHSKIDTLKIDIWESYEALKTRESMGKNLPLRGLQYFLHFEFKQ